MLNPNGPAAQASGLMFYCAKCNSLVDVNLASTGCCICSSKMFRVARNGNNPLFNDQLSDPYRAHDSEEDGYKMTTPGDEGSISGSGLGQNTRMPGPGFNEESQNSYLPTDIDCFDRNTDDVQSPAMTADDSPFNPMNHKEPSNIGPFNMQKSPKLNDLRMSVFDRIRKTRKGI